MLIEKKWYVIHAFSGCEQRVLDEIKARMKLSKMEHIFGEIIIPSEEIVSLKKGKNQKTTKKIFPGYIFVQMHMNENSWHFIRSLPKVLGFIGTSQDKPTPISNKEIEIIFKKIEKTKKSPKNKNQFIPGASVRVNQGPFIDFSGTIETVDYEKNRLKVSISIFGRLTPVELDFKQVETINV